MKKWAVGIYANYRDDQLASLKAVSALYDGLVKHGITPEFIVNSSSSVHYDVVFIFISDKAKTVYKRRHKMNKTRPTRVVLMDRSCFNMGGTQEFQSRESEWDKGNLYVACRLLDRKMNSIQLDNDPGDRFQLLHKHSWRTEGEYILIPEQVKPEGFCSDIEPRPKMWWEWAKRTVEEIRRYTDKPIKVRLHPRRYEIAKSGLIPQRLGVPGVCRYVNSEMVSLKEDLEDTHCVVTLSSKVAIEALLMGVPIHIADRHSLAYPMSTELEYISTPMRLQRTKWIKQLAHAHWTVSQLKSGKYWHYLRGQL